MRGFLIEILHQMPNFYCYNHNEEHFASGWHGKPVKTEKGIEIQHFCNENITYPEFTTQKIKDERVEFANDQLQRTRGGEWSREFFEAHPQVTKQMLKDKARTKKDIKNSKYVWRSDVKGVTKKVDAEALIK